MCDSDRLQLRLGYLKEIGLLSPPFPKRTVLTWSRHGQKIASISATVKEGGSNLQVILSYDLDNSPVSYCIGLAYTPSNLGIGMTPYFRCPSSLVKARVLYLYGGYFVSRKAIPRFTYESQLEPPSIRPITKVFKLDARLESLYLQLYRPYSKSTYRGKPTRRHRNLSRRIHVLEEFMTVNLCKAIRL